MKITYLNHSGFLLEWENCYWIFDYYRGEIPALNPEKEIFVFSSHSHKDHFEPKIFRLMEGYPRVIYIFSSEIRQKYRRLAKSVPGKKLPEITFLPSRTARTVSDGAGKEMQIYTLQSTDCGCAFLITYEGKTIYHAGDLHWWYWSGESEEFNKKMTADFKKEMEMLQGKVLDLIFTPLDPRQGPDYARGMNYILQKTEGKHVFPMHFWNDHSICTKYLEEHSVPEQTAFYPIEKDGQSWEINL